MENKEIEKMIKSCKKVQDRLGSKVTAKLDEADKELCKVIKQLEALSKQEVGDAESKAKEWADEFYDKESVRSSMIYENIEWENRFNNFLEGAKWMRSKVSSESSDAVLFAEWLWVSDFVFYETLGKWKNLKTDENITTSELYNLFKESLNPTKQ